MNLRVLIFLAFCSFCGCSTNLHYSPKMLESYSDEALLSDVKRGLRTQIAPYDIDTVEVDLEHFTTTKQIITNGRSLFRLNTSVAVPDTKTVYYDSIGKMDLISKRTKYIVFIREKETNNLMYTLGTNNESLATKFMDAVNTLSSRAILKSRYK